MTLKRKDKEQRPISGWSGCWNHQRFRGQSPLRPSVEVALLKEDRTKKREFLFLRLQGRVRTDWLTSSWVSLPQSVREVPGLKTLRQSTPSRCQTKSATEHRSSWGIRLPIPACNTWGEITWKNNDYHSQLQFKQEKKLKMKEVDYTG